MEQKEQDPVEARSGLPAWGRADLPTPPAPHGLGWLGVVGPGVIVLGAAIGSGEFLLGPAAFVNHGLTLLWVTGVAVLLQTLFNTEVMRYTLATGEPVITGFMRTRPRSTFWAAFYASLYFLQVGWPAWAGTAAAAIFFLFSDRLPGVDDASAVYWIGVSAFLVCAGALLTGRRVERTLELLNWILIVCILATFFVMGLLFVSPQTWLAAVTGFVGFDPQSGSFMFLPADADFFLLGALAAYSGAGGVGNLNLSNYARDRGYGMGQVTGYIPALIAGRKANLAHTGSTFSPTPEAMTRWRGWRRIVAADQWGVYFSGALLGMMLPAMLYVTFLPRGLDIRGLGVSAALAEAMTSEVGSFAAGVVAFMAVWLLLKAQLDIMEGMTRAITDILWTGSRRARAWSSGDVRKLYYTILTLVVAWGVIALGLAEPIILLQLGANVAGVIFIIASLHLLYLNTTLLPRELRPSIWRRAALIAMALFYGAFVSLWLASWVF